MTRAQRADVYKAGVLAAQLSRRDGRVEFSYVAEYLAKNGAAVASTLPLSAEPTVTTAGAVPAFFAGLLPEGRRLTALRRAVKTSADDELSLLLAVGADVVGDVQVVEGRAELHADSVGVTVERSFDDLSFGEILDQAGINATSSLAGVQDKISAAMISVPLARRDARYILKLNPPENPYLVENEAFFLDFARKSRMQVPASTIVHDRDGAAGLLVQRFDRQRDANGLTPLAVEDACQAMGLWPADKYNATMEQSSRALMALTPAATIAARDILRQLTFAWLTGNGDLHAKNISVLDSPLIGQRIAPAYDLPSTLFYDDNVLALTVGGKETLSATRLITFAREIGLPSKAIARTVGELISATAELGEALIAAALPFEGRATAKVARQLKTRHHEIEKTLPALEALE